MKMEATAQDSWVETNSMFHRQ